MRNKGTLYIVSTPIGNVEDITLRAIRILKESDIILCEDTRVSKKLFNLLDLKIDYKKLFSFNKFNEKAKEDFVLSNLNQGLNISLISDAGTPTISDPGQSLIKIARENNHNVFSIPGPSSIITAISSSGIKFKSFSFVGFLEKKEKKLISQIKESKTDLIVAFESPHRIIKTLNLLKKNFGDIEITIARELTKKFEEVITEKISILEKKIFKGEIVLIIKKLILK